MTLFTIYSNQLYVLKTNYHSLAPQFLKFLYNSSHRLSLDAAHALLTHACTTYGPLPDLQRTCQIALLHDMRHDHVLPIYSTVYNSVADRVFARGCARYLQYFATSMCSEAATRSGTNLFQLPIGALTALFAYRGMHIDSDVTLFRGLILWARSRLLARGPDQLDDTDRYLYQRRLRSVCNGRLELIRLSAMSVSQFSQCLDEVESPNALHCGGYGPGFFSLTELRSLTNGRLHIYHSHRAFEAPTGYYTDTSSSSGEEDDSDHVSAIIRADVAASAAAAAASNQQLVVVAPDFNMVDTTTNRPLPAYAEPHPEMLMRQQLWACRSLVGWLDRSHPALEPLIGGRPRRMDIDCHVGGFMAFEVRDRLATTHRRQVILGGMTVHVAPHLVRSIQLMTDWTPSQRLRSASTAGLAFRFQRSQGGLTSESRLWLDEPVRLQPGVLYRLVVLVNRGFAGQFASFDRENLVWKNGKPGPFWIPEVVKRPATTTDAERTLDVVTVNVSTLYYDYLE